MIQSALTVPGVWQVVICLPLQELQAYMPTILITIH